jgi:hypothetical protein
VDSGSHADRGGLCDRDGAGARAGGDEGDTERAVSLSATGRISPRTRRSASRAAGGRALRRSRARTSSSTRTARERSSQARRRTARAR